MRQIRVCCTATIFVMTAAAVAAAHDGKPHNFDDLWRSWSFDPLIIISLVLTAGFYLVGVYKLWKASGYGRAIKGWEAAAFAAALLSLVIALVSPLHPWGEVLFSAHMTQHEVLMLVSAPLLVLSRPLIASLWALPTAWRHPVGGLLKNGSVESVWHFITDPIAAWVIHAAALWIWHLPYLFQATLNSDLVHTFQHASFFGSALLFWWAIIASRRGVASYGAGILYLFTTSIHSGILGAFLTFSNNVLYPAYSASTSTWGLTPVEDQQLGGLIMWVPAGLVYILAALIMFAGWLNDSEKRVLKRERTMWAEAE
ncbi:MAG: cytochrome c oxidase assembly protein [Pyrinomonadaceae bacterium]